jgi:hypothetical protein
MSAVSYWYVISPDLFCASALGPVTEYCNEKVDLPVANEKGDVFLNKPG